MKRFLFFLSFVAFFFLFFTKTFASEEFKTEYNINYQVNESGIVSVNHEISLTNKLSRVYATQYSLILPTTQITNIEATDEDGPCKLEINKDNETTTIIIKFNQEVVGIDKTLTFNLTYQNLSAAVKKGEIWEINIPRISSLSDIDNYNISLNIPKTFGNPAFIRPEPIEVKDEGSFFNYRFTQKKITESGIKATFGPFQIFDFTLFYNLENNHYTKAEASIALPPDTAFQKINFKRIDPLPLNIVVDEDGNWLAKYILKPKEKVKIIVTGKVKILAESQKDFPKPSQEALENNLLKAPFWEINDTQIVDLANKLKTPRAIYNYIVNTLDYDFERVSEGVERLGAKEALNNPEQAICMEFTDLFIALSRAAGIPAREINGFAYTDDIKLRPLNLVTDVLHAWPEYYDKEKGIWIPVDPTWEKTTKGVDYFYKGDLNHFVFVIHGKDSELPYPAGSYKTPNSLEKTVQVVFSEYEQETEPELKINFDIPSKIFWKENKKGRIIVKNEGKSALYNLKIDIEVKGLNLSLEESLKKIEILPPFSYKEIPLAISSDNFFANGGGLLKISVNGESFEKQIEMASFIWQIIIPTVGGLITLLTLFILLKKKF